MFIYLSDFGLNVRGERCKFFPFNPSIHPSIHPSINFLYPLNPLVGSRGGWSLYDASFHRKWLKKWLIRWDMFRLRGPKTKSQGFWASREFRHPNIYSEAQEKYMSIHNMSILRIRHEFRHCTHNNSYILCQKAVLIIDIYRVVLI